MAVNQSPIQRTFQKTNVKSVRNGSEQFDTRYREHTANKYSRYDSDTRSDVSSAVNFAYKTIDALATMARNETDSLINKMMQISVSEFCDFNTKNGVFMLRLMELNDKETDITLNALGTNAAFNGDGSAITNMALAPSYAAARNYTELFAKKIVGNENSGQNTTRAVDGGVDSYKKENNSYDKFGQLYKTVTNLYPDDNDSGKDEFINKWKLSNSLDTILKKTKDLFRGNKINTLISRFHTDPTAPKSIGDVGSQYGLSHGRNLLTKKAENGEPYATNGYDNPYCRVWTHHHQYDRLNRLIRPFYTENNGVIRLKDFHTWSKFLYEDKDKNGKEDKKIHQWGWKNGDARWDLSVLDTDNGMVNITPKYRGGGKFNIHTKQCMFSIENLAWQGYDPYSFEQALSWEQRGPFGGRIMWFPPYGISFNENVTTNWNSNTFIGRGEDVYTYTNTIRQGTLNFMLVVDHPSIINYLSWDEQSGSKGVSDTDLLRFFAGCDSGDADSVLKKATPTPLTDEYIQETIDVTENVKEKPKPPTPVPEPDVTDEYDIVFFVFYPNNYAGYYDKPGSTVEAMAYLLAGSQAQKQKDDNDGMRPKDSPLTFDNLADTNIKSGGGYEMNSAMGDSDGENYIRGHVISWKRTQNKVFQNSKTKQWYYRIDGKYEFPNNDTEINRNTFDQTLLNKSNYVDNSCYYLNSNKDKVKECFLLGDEVKLYSFAEVAAAVTKNTNVRDKIAKNSGLDFSTDEFTELQEIFNGDNTGTRKYKIKSIIAEGYSNSHGNNTKSVNDERNITLAENRAESVLEWLRSENITADVMDTGFLSSSTPVSASDKLDASGITAKMYRSAKVTIKIEKTTTKPLSETDGSYEDENGNNVKEYVRFTGWTEHDDGNGGKYYINANETDPQKKNRKWVYDENTKQMVYAENVSRGYSFTLPNVTLNGGEVNKLRYDQEYHFFKVLKEHDRMTYQKLMDKIKYFDPAFHSGTPEGFNGRLTFLQQCMRQGNTISASDPNAKSANNLAFGRPPFVIIRIGDFFYTKAVIDNMSISYDPLQWDLNTEGLGVQPLIANISLSFKFIGGQGMSGAVSRLQNAMSFNYYANTELYDNRADIISYNWNDKEGGAVDHNIIVDDSSFYKTKMQD